MPKYEYHGRDQTVTLALWAEAAPARLMPRRSAKPRVKSDSLANSLFNLCVLRVRHERVLSE